MTDANYIVGVHHHRLPPAIFADRRSDFLHCVRAPLASVLGVVLGAINRPEFDMHARPPESLRVGILSEGALCAGLSNRPDYDCTPELGLRALLFPRHDSRGRFRQRAS